MENEIKDWHEPPQEFFGQFDDILSRVLHSPECPKEFEKCPSCNEPVFFFFRHVGAWVWCSRCMYIIHCRAKPPLWWKEMEHVNFDKTKITVSASYMDTIRDIIIWHICTLRKNNNRQGHK